MSLTDTLKRVTEINNFNELNNIVMEINNSQFSTYKDLVLKLRTLVDEFDPVDRAATISQILSMIRPDVKELLDPVNIILLLDPKKESPTCLCFARKRT